MVLSASAISALTDTRYGSPGCNFINQYLLQDVQITLPLKDMNTTLAKNIIEKIKDIDLNPSEAPNMGWRRTCTFANRRQRVAI